MRRAFPILEPNQHVTPDWCLDLRSAWLSTKQVSEDVVHFSICALCTS